ncbi:MAG: tyrosine-type recombinase/integrase [bacterium]|nr:tyrosine-type recombinase/integrase [bacterium]
MRRFRFTVQALAALTTTKNREFVHDDQVPALAVQVTGAGGKSFYVVKRHGPGKVVRRLGSLDELSIPKARMLAAQFVSSLALGEEPEPVLDEAPLLVRQALAEYLGYAREHLSRKTVKDYQSHVARHLSRWAGTRPLIHVRRKEVTALHQSLGQRCGHCAANRVLAFLRAALNRAIREHELDMPNPAAGVRFYREEARTRRLFPEELPAFFQAVRDESSEDVRDFLLLALYTGARKGNLLAMRWEDISFPRAVWIVPAGQSKNGRELQVVLSSHALELLEARRQGVDSPFVFPGREGGRISADPAQPRSGHMANPKVGWERVLTRAGLCGLRMHDLRRSLASFQIDTGTPLEVIQKTLGHESKATTEIYARLATGPVRASLEKATAAMLACGDSMADHEGKTRD